jgi:hypothetical protein
MVDRQQYHMSAVKSQKQDVSLRSCSTNERVDLHSDAITRMALLRRAAAPALYIVILLLVHNAIAQIRKISVWKISDSQSFNVSFEICSNKDGK